MKNEFKDETNLQIGKIRREPSDEFRPERQPDQIEFADPTSAGCRIRR